MQEMLVKNSMNILALNVNIQNVFRKLNMTNNDTQTLLEYAGTLEWQDITSAPKHISILVKDDCGECHEGMFSTDEYDEFYGKYTWAWTYGSAEIDDSNFEPTHWIPLPTGNAGEVIRDLVEVMTHPTEEMCDAARAYILYIRITNGCSYDGMREHFNNMGTPVPLWLQEKQGHITKHDTAEDIWKLMSEQALAKAVEHIRGEA